MLTIRRIKLTYYKIICFFSSKFFSQVLAVVCSCGLVMDKGLIHKVHIQDNFNPFPTLHTAYIQKSPKSNPLVPSMCTTIWMDHWTQM